MSDQHLRKLIGAAQAERERWLKEQTLLARSMRNGLSRKLGRQIRADTAPIDLPEEDEIVNETIMRVLARKEGYVWDEQSKFDFFFARSLRRTLDSMRSRERRHHANAIKLNPELNVHFATPQLNAHELLQRVHDSIAQNQSAQTLASAIAETRMYGHAVTYVGRLGMYAATKMTTEEIADDLGVKPGSIDPYRKRIRRLIKGPGSE